MIVGDKHSSCKLCLSSARPLCRSHVVPEFCYEYEHEENRRYAYALKIENDDLTKTVIQKGYREYLLCADCEQRFSRHERIFAECWVSQPEIKGPMNHGQILTLSGINYQSTKLFLLSVFWRCSVSRKLGRGIQFGPYQEKLRTILLDDRAVPQEHYPIFCSMILDPNGFPFSGYIDSPYCIRTEGTRSYRMPFAGCMWTLIMSDHWIPKKIEGMKHLLSETGQFHLLAQNYHSFRSIRQVGRAIQKKECDSV